MKSVSAELEQPEREKCFLEVVEPKPPLEVIVIGAGNRGRIYSSYSLLRPDRLKVVAVADPVYERAAALGSLFNVKRENLLASYTDVEHRPRIADAAINSTMDQLHVPSTKVLLRNGYHVLLEKPISTNEEEIIELIDLADRKNLKVMVGHVLRYAPFFRTVKNLLNEGMIGRVLAVHSSEHVEYAHYVTSFVRGRWNRSQETAPMMLAKCCHDLDLITWYLDHTRPVSVASYGGLSFFKRENAPKGSANRCLDGCQIETSCVYSARKIYADKNYLWPASVWGDQYQNEDFPDRESRLRILKNDSPYGRCVWRCDNDVVDHQNLIVDFADGAIATHNMFCNTARPTRRVHLVGTHGEIDGDLTEQIIKIHRMTQDARWTTEEINVSETNVAFDTPDGAIQVSHGHGGGDARLIEDFVATILGEPQADGSNSLKHSLAGHQIAFAAEQAMNEGRGVSIKPAKFH